MLLFYHRITGIYSEMPLSLKVYNTFRSRWCGAYLQSKGIKVIPTVAWGEPNTFWFCFDGIEKGSTVAVSTLGVRTEKTLFMQGYDEMLRKIKPSTIICYGKPFDEMKGEIIEVDYAEVNNLNKNFQHDRPISLGPAQYDNKTNTYIKRVCGFICTDKVWGRPPVAEMENHYLLKVKRIRKLRCIKTARKFRNVLMIAKAGHKKI